MVREDCAVTEKRFIEVRIAEDPDRMSPGRLQGVLMPYETRAADRPEVFEQDSLSWPDDGVLVREMHDRKRPIVRVVPEVRGSEVVIDTPLPDTTAGRDAAAAIRAKVYQSLSVEFRAEDERYVSEVRRIRKARLTGAGLVDAGAYSAATVEVRHKNQRRRWWQ